jgi:hypothetical protein
MTIPAVSSNGPLSASDVQASYNQQRSDFQALASALQSGDINSAQQAFAQLQKDSPRLAQALSSDPSSSDSPRIADLKSLASALKSGDISGAQQAFAKLQTEVKSAHHGHHHHATASTSGTDADGDNDGSSSVGTVINATA